MTRYIALIDGEAGAYGASFPDLDGCTAMGADMDEALLAAQEALRDYVETGLAQGEDIPAPRTMEQLRLDPEVREALAQGATFVSVALVRGLSRPVKANLSLDSGVLAAIDASASRLGVTRSALVELLAREHLSALL
jgi:predicted RNase H-like HicB family nuclease